MLFLVNHACKMNNLLLDKCPKTSRIFVFGSVLFYSFLKPTKQTHLYYSIFYNASKAYSHSLTITGNFCIFSWLNKQWMQSLHITDSWFDVKQEGVDHVSIMRQCSVNAAIQNGNAMGNFQIDSEDKLIVRLARIIIPHTYIKPHLPLSSLLTCLKVRFIIQLCLYSWEITLLSRCQAFKRLFVGDAR